MAMLEFQRTGASTTGSYFEDISGGPSTHSSPDSSTEGGHFDAWAQQGPHGHVYDGSSSDYEESDLERDDEETLPVTEGIINPADVTQFAHDSSAADGLQYEGSESDEDELEPGPSSVNDSKIKKPSMPEGHVDAPNPEIATCRFEGCVTELCGTDVTCSRLGAWKHICRHFKKYPKACTWTHPNGEKCTKTRFMRHCLEDHFTVMKQCLKCNEETGLRSSHVCRGAPKRPMEEKSAEAEMPQAKRRKAEPVPKKDAKGKMVANSKANKGKGRGSKGKKTQKRK